MEILVDCEVEEVDMLVLALVDDVEVDWEVLLVEILVD